MKVIVDGNSIFFKVLYGLRNQNLTNSEGFPTGAIYWFIKFLNYIQNTYKYRFNDIIITFDNPTSKKKRQEIFSDYKADRKTKDEIIYKQLHILIALLKAEGLTVCSYVGYEADDVCNTICKLYENEETIVISRDKDLLQVISNPRSSVLLDNTKEYIKVDEDNFQFLYPFKYEYFSDYKIILWDKSDNVPGIPRLWKKSLENLFIFLGNNNIPFQDIIDDKIVIDEPKIKKIIDKIHENKDIYDRNKKVLGLMVVENLRLEQLQSLPNPEKAKNLLDKLEIKTPLIKTL